jgi:hypothetical protein
MLALRAGGVGAARTTLHLRYEQEAAAVLGIPARIKQAALLPVAYYTGDDFKPARRIPARQRTYSNSWQQHASTAYHNGLAGLVRGKGRFLLAQPLAIPFANHLR